MAKQANSTFFLPELIIDPPKTGQGQVGWPPENWVKNITCPTIGVIDPPKMGQAKLVGHLKIGWRI